MFFENRVLTHLKNGVKIDVCKKGNKTIVFYSYDRKTINKQDKCRHLTTVSMS